MEPETPPQDQTQSRPTLADIKARRGRPTNAEIIAKAKAAEAPAPTPATSIVLKPSHVEGLTNLPFAGCAMIFKTKEWNLTKDEQEFLSAPLAEFLNEILPDLARQYPKGAILIACFVSVGLAKAAKVSATVPKSPVTNEPVKQPAAPQPVEEGRRPIITGQDPRSVTGITEFEAALAKRAK